MNTLNIRTIILKQIEIPHWSDLVVHVWLTLNGSKLPMPRTHFHGPKGVRALKFDSTWEKCRLGRADIDHEGTTTFCLYFGLISFLLSGI